MLPEVETGVRGRVRIDLGPNAPDRPEVGVADRSHPRDETTDEVGVGRGRGESAESVSNEQGEPFLEDGVVVEDA